MRTLAPSKAKLFRVPARRRLSAGFCVWGSRLGMQPGWYQPVEKLVERLFVVETHRTGFVDVDPFEEGLVENAAIVVVGLQVGGVAVAGKVEALRKVGSRIVVGGLRADQPLLNAEELVPDAVLLRLEQVEWDSAGVVGLKQLVSLIGEFVSLLCEAAALAGVLLVQTVKVLGNECFDAVAKVRA